MLNVSLTRHSPFIAQYSVLADASCFVRALMKQLFSLDHVNLDINRYTP